MLTQTATYAVRAMGYLAQEKGEKPVLTQTIADEMDIPKNFLSKIMHTLVKAKLVRSMRGTHGGFVLAKKPSEINLKAVVSLFMDVDVYKNCLLGRHECTGSCKVHKKWKPIVDKIGNLLENTTIDEVL